MIPTDILIAEVNRLRALLHEQNITICQTLAAAMGCYPHAPDETGAEDPTAPYVVDPAVAEDVAQAAADMIRELRTEVASLRQGWQAERDAALRAHDLLIAEREAARLTLAAEQGRQEGAPVGWQWDITLGCWRRGQWGVNAVLVDRLGDADDGWGWRLPSERHQNTAPQGIWTARAAMQAADAAQEPR